MCVCVCVCVCENVCDLCEILYVDPYFYIHNETSPNLVRKKNQQ